VLVCVQSLPELFDISPETFGAFVDGVSPFDANRLELFEVCRVVVHGLVQIVCLRYAPRH
jgi:hypothetical protein